MIEQQKRWWCCGVERSTDQRCSCGEKYEEKEPVELRKIKNNVVIFSALPSEKLIKECINFNSALEYCRQYNFQIIAIYD